jgi:hypothetical protein
LSGYTIMLCTSQRRALQSVARPLSKRIVHRLCTNLRRAMARRGLSEINSSEAVTGESESDIVWRSNLLVNDPGAPLEQRWISIPKNVWHRPVIPKGDDWVVGSFHTVAAEELIEERPGAKRMRYLD